MSTTNLRRVRSRDTSSSAARSARAAIARWTGRIFRTWRTWGMRLARPTPIGTLVYSWPQALEKARAADAIVRQRLEKLGLSFEEIYTEYFGVNACHGAVAPANADPPEVQLRIGVRGADKKAVDRFTRELIPLVLNGPPGATGFGEGRPPVREIVAYWPALLPREEIRTSVTLLE